MDHDHPREARAILEALHGHFPRDPAVLNLLLIARHDLHDILRYQHYAEQLLAIHPDGPGLLLGLAGAAVNERGHRINESHTAAQIRSIRSPRVGHGPTRVDSNPFPASTRHPSSPNASRSA